MPSLVFVNLPNAYQNSGFFAKVVVREYQHIQLNKRAIDALDLCCKAISDISSDNLNAQHADS